MTPSFVNLLLLDKSFNSELMPELRKILFCGEKLTAKMKQDKVIRIIAFVKLKEKDSVTSHKIKADLIKKIPDYMCLTIKIIDKFPLNKNGKCDEDELLEEY